MPQYMDAMRDMRFNASTPLYIASGALRGTAVQERR